MHQAKFNYLQIQNKISKHFTLLVLIGIAANALGLFNEIMEPDGALYASIAKYIAKNNDWINLYGYGTDWLDKPHFPFWAAALSYKIFGFTAFAYKLPSFICFLLGCYYTFKLTQKIYCTQTAQLATIIYITSLHVILSNYDVRAEGYLTAFIIAAIYHLYNAQKNNWFTNILFASLFTALAIMTKGIFVFISIGSGFVIYWILSKQYKQFINLKWYLYVLLSLVFIFPELYSLYQQFDVHPEKIVFGKTNVSGLKFFFWDSQFGRFFNTGPIQGSGDITFFVHTTLWAFLPWAFYLIYAIVNGIKNIKNNKTNEAVIIYSSALCSFILFSVSKFQLPHYIVIIFPLLAIIVSRYLMCNAQKFTTLLQYTQHIVFIVLLVLVTLLSFVFKLDNTILCCSILTIVALIYFIKLKEKTLFNIVVKGAIFGTMLSVFLNLFFYPQLMQYQAGMMAGKWQQKNASKEVIPMFRCNEFSFEFYGNTQMKRENYAAELFANKQKSKVFIPVKEIENINKDSFAIKHFETFQYFHITELTPKFLNYKTRHETLDSFAIVEISKKY